MPTSPSPQPFDSLLPTGRERFLAQVMVHALQDGWATAEDFLRHFRRRSSSNPWRRWRSSG